MLSNQQKKKLREMLQDPREMRHERCATSTDTFLSVMGLSLLHASKHSKDERKSISSSKWLL